MKVLLIRIGSERWNSRPFASNTRPTALRFSGSAISVYNASDGIAITPPRRITAAARSIASGCGWLGSISIRSVATPDRLRDLDRHLVSPERSAQLHALNHGAYICHHFARDRDAFPARFFGIVDAAHAFHKRLRHRDAQFVHHELGIAVTR